MPGFERFAPVLLLLASNVFMTFAWYGHLKYRSAPLLLAVVAICLTILAILSFTTGQADLRLAQRCQHIHRIDNGRLQDVAHEAHA